jgi:hypothetical protein
MREERERERERESVLYSIRKMKEYLHALILINIRKRIFSCSKNK